MPQARSSAQRQARSLAQRKVGELVATLPGAAAAFRRLRFDFCCMLERSVAELAAAHETPLELVEAALLALPDQPRPSAPKAAEALIGHILSRFHLAHRQELPELARLAAQVEERHRGHPDVPFGLADVLAELAQALEEHMRHEETSLFPLIRRGGAGFERELETVHAEHEALVSYLCCVETMTARHQPPADACRRWCELYAGTEKLVDDLVRHRHLEEDVLARSCRTATILDLN